WRPPPREVRGFPPSLAPLASFSFVRCLAPLPGTPKSPKPATTKKPLATLPSRPGLPDGARGLAFACLLLARPARAAVLPLCGPIPYGASAVAARRAPFLCSPKRSARLECFFAASEAPGGTASEGPTAALAC
ncbi:hypothetical protein OIU85_027108, partial [Salix viminalis]